MCFSTIIFHSLYCILSNDNVQFTSPWSSVRQSAGMISHFCVWAEAELSYVIQGGIRGKGALRLAGPSGPISWPDDGLAQAGDPLLLAEGVVGLQAVRASFGAPSAAHTETVFHWDGMTKMEEGNWVEAKEEVMLQLMGWRGHCFSIWGLGCGLKVPPLTLPLPAWNTIITPHYCGAKTIDNLVDIQNINAII